jgi:hypothetical protein
MIRVYFDWNIFANLKRESEEPFKSILKIIRNHKGKLLFPYSPAHLRDLKRGFDVSERAKSKTYNDLKLLQEISKDHCLYFDYKDKKVTPNIIDPIEYFNQLTEDKTTETFDFDNIFQSDTSDSLSQLWKSYIDLMKLIPTSIKLEQIDSVPEKYGKVKEMFPNLRTGNNYYNLMKDVSKIITAPEEYADIYKSARNASVDEMKINTNPKEWGNAFDYLDSVLTKSKANKTFREMIEDSLKARNKDKPLERFDYFTNYYISLDTFGYFRDKEFQNLIDDATHAYYGAYCDIFVTEDKNTYHKAKAIYEHFNLSTTVCKASDFSSVFYSMNELGDNPSQTISNRMIEIIHHSFILLKSFDDEFNPVMVYKVQHPLVDFFNRMQTSFYRESTSLFFYKKKDTYSAFMFWSEIKNIVDKIVLDFGTDDNLRGEFNHEIERQEINDKKWKGRIWKRNSIIIIVNYDYEDFGLILKVNFPELKN